MPFTPEHAIDLLKHAYHSERMPHALLLTGAKECTDRLILQLAEFLCGIHAESPETILHPGCRVIRPNSKIRTITIDSIRSSDDFLHTVVPAGVTKLVVVCEADRLTEDSGNAFLKTLEEPPEQTLIILATELADSLLSTIRSRCIRLDLASPEQGERLNDVQSRFLPTLRKALANVGSDVAALALRADFQDFMENERAEITERLTSAVKAEAKHFAEVTGVSDWESRQKDATIAMIETEYLARRSHILELFTLCLGQAVLLASHAKDVRPSAPEIQSLAEHASVPNLIARMRAVEALRKDLIYNVNEALALDARLSRIIGSSLS